MMLLLMGYNDDKKWKGSQDGESDKENNFVSPTSSKSKRSFAFPSTQTASEVPDTDKIKFTDNHSSNGLSLPLDIPDENGLKNEDDSDVDEDEENFGLSIDESNEHTITTPIFNDSKADAFVDRLIDSGSSPSHSSPDVVSYSQSVNYTGAVSMYNGGSDDADENSIDYIVKPSNQSNCETPTTHLPASFHLSGGGGDSCESRSKLEEIPIVEPICDEELPGFNVKRDGELVNGERHLDEFDEPRCEDGRLSLYSDEPIDEEPMDEEPMDEYDETLIDEDGEESDVSEFGVDGRHRDEMFDRTEDKEMNGDRTSSDYSDTTPENIELNKFTPLNTVQVSNASRHTPDPMPTPADVDMMYSNLNGEPTQSMHENESDFPDHRSTPTSNYDESGMPTNVTDMSSDLPTSEHSKTANLPDKPAKKRKGKTLDDIVRKISSANEQAAEKKTNIGDEEAAENDKKTENDQAWSNGDDKQVIKKEDGTEDTEQNDAEKSNSSHEGSRENNVYWSAGKAFHKRNISYKCKYCEHRFDDETLLKDHERSHGQHQCRNCNEVFLTSAALFEHREVAHAFKPRQRYNKCRFCPTLYADPAMLQRHEEIHHLSRSPVTPGHGEDAMSDLPPPLMSIDESQRKFPRYENHRELSRNEQGYRPRSPREMKPGRNPGEMDPYERREVPAEDEEGKSIVRNPIRNLLGKMYQTQKKMEHGGGERFPHRYSTGYRSKMPPSSHQFHYADYPRCYSVPQSRPSPEHGQRENREYRPDMRPPEHTTPAEEDSKGFRELVHICRICNKSFGMKDTLEQHWLTAHPDTPTYSCEVCHEIFIEKEDLGSHMSIHLKQDYYCGYCRKAFDCRSTYESHMRAHSNDRPFTCHICGRAFSLRTNLRRHILIHTDITPYRCHVCFKGFRRSDMLSSHIKQYHAGSDEKCRNYDPNDPAYRGDRRSDDQNANDSVSPVFQPPSGSNSPYTPRHDNNNINGHESYNNNSPNHHNDDPKVYPIESRMKHSPDSMPIKHSPNSPRVHHSPNVSRHESGDVNAMNHSMVPMSHMPNVVGMHQVPNEHSFHRPNGMLTPMGSDRPPHQLVAPIPVMKQARFSPYKTNLVNILPLPVTSSRMECNECGEKFTSESLYEIHMQSHVKEASYTCRKCRRTFSGKSQYNSHMQTHENNKSHSCPYCHRSFSMKGNLRRHIRIHTNEAPYECPICFQRFRRSDGLKGHIKRHDAMGESAPGDMVPSQAST